MLSFEEDIEDVLISIRTQQSYELNGRWVRPDIEIKVGCNTLIFVECKVYSPEGENQLANYCSVLENQSQFVNKHLVYISVFPGYKRVDSQYLKFSELVWNQISDICSNCTILAYELGQFITDYSINMNSRITHLDALVLQNMKMVFEKLDYVLDTIHNYHKSEEGLGIRLDSGKSISLIKSYGYYMSGKKMDIEYVVGFFGEPISLIYRIQGQKIDPVLVSRLVSKEWKEHYANDLLQVDKSMCIEKFMSEDGNDLILMIDFVKRAILDLKN